MPGRPLPRGLRRTREAELAKIQDKVKPVVAKFAPQIGEDFVKGFQAEIEKVRAAK